MPAPLLTQELVNVTANKLFAEHGKRPSNRTVRSALGVGSMTTITRLMNNWRDESPPLGAVARALPEKLLFELEQLQRDAEKAVRENSSTDLANARDSEQQLVEENEQLMAQIASLQTEQQAAREDGVAAHAQVAQLQADNAILKRELENERVNAGQLRIELAKASLRLDESLPQLKQELNECRLQLDASRKAQSEAELKAAVALERAAGLEQRLSELKR